MWNSRFVAVSGRPVRQRQGLFVSAAGGARRCRIIPTCWSRRRSFPRPSGTKWPAFEFEGDNDDLRAEVIGRLNNSANYRLLFRAVYPEIGPDDPIVYDHLAAAIAEFEFAMTFATPRSTSSRAGERTAMTDPEKRGALLFFGKGRLRQVPRRWRRVERDVQRLYPPRARRAADRSGNTNSPFDGAGANEDFGLEQVTGDERDRYKFRTSPLRNLALQPTFFHDGAFTRLEEAVAHHLDVTASVKNYSPVGRLPEDLCGPRPPMDPVLARRDDLVRRPVRLTGQEFADLTEFVRTGCSTAAPPRSDSPRSSRRRFPATLSPWISNSLAVARDNLHEQNEPNLSGRIGRGGMVGGWGWLGFWRSVIGERSRKHAIPRLGPPWPALEVVGRWLAGGFWRGALVGGGGFGLGRVLGSWR
jgi:cytochrome c peroxidase